MRFNRRYKDKCLAILAGSLLAISAAAQQAPVQGTAASTAALANALSAPSTVPADNNLQQLPAPAPVPTQAPTIPALSNNAPLASSSAADVSSALPTSPESDPAVVQAARDQAFNQLTLNTLPMTPAQIQKLRNLFADSQRAATSYPGGAPPKPVASTQLVSLEPGATPPIIRLAQGYVTSLVFLDSTGAPWPIQSYDIGNPGAFNVQWDRSSNILMIQSSAMYTTGNLVVQLRGLNTPVSISLIPGQPIVDYRTDMRVQGLGPNAKPGVQGALPQAAPNDLLNVLDGVPPANAKNLAVPGSTSQAWLVGDKMFLRTHLTLLSPAWVSSMSSADGTNAYQIPKAPSILVADNDGKIFNLRVEGY